MFYAPKSKYPRRFEEVRRILGVPVVLLLYVYTLVI